MKKNLRRLQWVARLFGEENFYAARVHADTVILQAKFDTDISTKAVKLNFKCRANLNGFIVFTREKHGVIYDITLT